LTSLALREPPVSEAAGTAIEAVGVTMRYGGITALSDVSFDARHGEVTGLVGPNGAGKSTLFAVLSGLQSPNAGRVLLGGVDVTRTTPEQRARNGLARTFQHPELFVDLTVREHLVLAWRLRNARSRLVTDVLTGRGLVRRPDRREGSAIAEIIELLGLEDAADRQAVELPLARTRLVEIGRALACSPQVLLLDEPLAGLDLRDRERLSEVLTRVVEERGISLVLVEHDVEMVLGMASTVFVLDFGACIARGAPAEIRADPAVRAAYLGDLD
jgi:ABC-type branched-subunit amino acid transport system ATPase component